MPTLPSNTKCASLGCKNTRSKLNSYCLEHGGKDTYKEKRTEERIAFNAMYQTRHWKQVRTSQLSKQPLCQSCLTRGIVTPAKHVDHLFPWSWIGEQAFYRNIFQSLCHECHSHKTSLEQDGIFMHYINNQTTEYKLTDYALVMANQYGMGAKEVKELKTS